MLTLEQKNELYRFFCKKINYGIHPINTVAQLLADHQMSSQAFGYGRLKNMLRDLPEFMTLILPNEENEEMRVRFSIWQKGNSKVKTAVVATKKRRERGAVLSKPVPPTSKTPTMPLMPETLLSYTQIDDNMLHLLALKTGRIEASLPSLLESSYQQAKALNALDFSGDNMNFRLDVDAKNGNPLIVTFRRDAKAMKKNQLYHLIYVDDNNAPTARLQVNQIVNENPALALETFAFLGKWEDFLQSLAELARPEEWDFPHADKRNHYILKKYIQYTFYRIQFEGKVLLSENKRLAVFNTGLVDCHFDDIYACFVPNNAGESPWLFKEFCIAGHRGLGKQLIQHFNPLPQAATYFKRKEDLLFDLERDIHCDYDHILIENIDRFPLSFLHNQFYDHPSIMKHLRQLEKETDPEAKERAYETIRQLLDENMLLYNRLKNRLDDAVLLALKEVRWNYRTAIPSYYPARNTMNFMLPLHLTSNTTVDNVLVVELTPAGNYQGQTILTCDQAYIDARLICSFNSQWLTPKKF